VLRVMRRDLIPKPFQLAHMPAKITAVAGSAVLHGVRQRGSSGRRGQAVGAGEADE